MSDELNASVKVELKSYMDEIELKLQELSEALRSSTPKAQVYVLPLITKEDEKTETEFIPVETVTGDEAVELVIQAYKKFIIDDNVSLKCVYRLPGFIQVNKNHELISNIVESINQLKIKFKDKVISSGPRMVRFRLVHDLFPYTNTKQIYRRINIHKGAEVCKVKFIWARKYIVQAVTKSEVLKQLNDQIDDRSLDSAWIKLVKEDIKKVKRLPDNTDLRIKRDIKQHPMIIINNDDQLQCSLPIIILQNADFIVRELQDFDASASRSQRSDVMISDVPIVKRLHLYQINKTD